MMQVDFPTWLGIGSYGGLIFSVVAAAGVAIFALRLRRGTPRQLARAMLVCLSACCLSFVPIWWEQTRFDLLGPTLAPTEIGFWLGWIALFAWGVPLGTLAGYLLLAAPQPATGRVAVPPQLRAPLQFLGIGPLPVELRDPRRSDEPLGPGRAWGQLVPLRGDASGRPIPLTHAVVVIGRESDCDLVVDDDLASRQHAELRWERGRVHLVDRGSLNGTRVNGQGVAGQVPLRSGDVVEIGDQRFRFEPRISGASGQATGSVSDPDDPDQTRKMAGVGRSSQPSQPLAPALCLVAATGPEPGRRWGLTAPLSTIGRDPSSDICLPDPSVSRRHAQIVRQATGLYVQDVTSENGTCLDGQELTGPAPLRLGAVLTVGVVDLRCEALPAHATPPALPVASEMAPGGPATPLPAGAPPATAATWGMPDLHHLMGPQLSQRDHPHLAPPRLLPDQPARSGDDSAPQR